MVNRKYPPTLLKLNSVNNLYAHGACSTCDHAHCAVNVSSVEVRHLGLSDLSDLLLGNLADLGLVGNAGTALKVDCLLDENSSRRSLSNEGEGTVCINCDNYRNDKTDIVLGSLIEFLGECHDIYTVLTECRANRGSRCSLTCCDLKLD